MSQGISKREINRLAIPAIISGIAEPIIALVDTAFIGHIGTAELAASGIASSFFLLLVWVLSQTRTAISALVAQYHGRNDLKGISDLVPTSIWMNILLGFFCIALTLPFSEWIFRMYDAAGAVLSNATLYFDIRCWGYPFVLGSMALFGIFRGVQNTSWAMWISIAGGVVNLILDPILIFGLGSVPALGLAGAAYASVMAQVIMFVLSIIVLRRKTAFKLIPLNWWHPELVGLLTLSGNLFIRTIALNVGFYLANKYATGYGNEYIAAHSIAINIWLFSAFFIDGYAHAAAALSGKLKGQQQWRELYKLGKRLTWLSVRIALFLSVVYAISYPWVGSVFSDSALVIATFNSVFWIVILSQPINAMSFALDGVFKGMGDGRLLRNVLVMATLLVFIPSIMLFDRSGWMLIGIWVTFALWMMARGLPLAWVFHKRFGPSGTFIAA